ncbi:hypothetical protein Trydic_g19095 [Trypoxylus dichotomus]
MHEGRTTSQPSSMLQQSKFTPSVPQIQREVQTFDFPLPLSNLQHRSRTLKSRYRSLAGPLDGPPANYTLLESSLGGMSCSFEIWRMLNSIRTGVTPMKVNLIIWGLAQPNIDMCKCGATQNMEHLME